MQTHIRDSRTWPLPTLDETAGARCCACRQAVKGANWTPLATAEYVLRQAGIFLPKHEEHDGCGRVLHGKCGVTVVIEGSKVKR